MLVSFLLPTRGRKDMFIKSIDSLISNSSEPNCFEVLAGVDYDDFETTNQLKEYYKDNSNIKFFEFERQEPEQSIELLNKNSIYDVERFFNNIFDRIKYIHSILLLHPNKKVYIWPCSMHTIYIFSLGLNVDRIEAILDNAPHKIGQYLYGYKIKCISYNNVLESQEECIIILNGGCYNKELNNKNYSHITFI